MTPIPTPRTDRLKSALVELKGIGSKKAHELTYRLADIEILRAQLDAKYDEAMQDIAAFLWADGKAWTEEQINASSLSKEPRLILEYRKQKYSPCYDTIYHWQTTYGLNIRRGALWFCISTFGEGPSFESPAKDMADKAAKEFIDTHQLRHERDDIRCRLLQAYLDGQTESSPKAAHT